MNIISLWMKAANETKMGRLRFHHAMWAVVGSRWSKARAGRDAKHPEVTLVKRLSVTCPSPPEGDFAQMSDGWNVPATECRRCSHHIPASRHARYPCCGVLRAQNANRDIRSEVQGVISEAFSKAEEILQ